MNKMMREQIFVTFVPTKKNYSFKNQFSYIGITKSKQYRFDYSVPRKYEGMKPAKDVICNNKNKNNQEQN